MTTSLLQATFGVEILETLPSLRYFCTFLSQDYTFQDCSVKPCYFMCLIMANAAIGHLFLLTAFRLHRGRFWPNSAPPPPMLWQKCHPVIECVPDNSLGRLHSVARLTLTTSQRQLLLPLIQWWSLENKLHSLLVA